MGSTIIGVLACLFLECLESGLFKQIIPKSCTYQRYIDDVFIILPWYKAIRQNTETQ